MAATPCSLAWTPPSTVLAQSFDYAGWSLLELLIPSRAPQSLAGTVMPSTAYLLLREGISLIKPREHQRQLCRVTPGILPITLALRGQVGPLPQP